MKNLRRLFIAITIGLNLMALMSLVAWASNLLANGGLNYPYNPIPGRTWQGQDELIADGWNAFYIESGTHEGDENAGRLHWMSAAQFAASFGGIDYRLEGDQAQNMWSSYEFDAGIYQQLAVVPGQDYGFDIGMVTYWRGPGYPDSDGLMSRQVGIDPFGGTDPTSSNIIWSELNANDKAWVYMDVAATAQAMTMTVFAKVQAPENESFNHTDLDMVYFDAARVDLAPATTLTTTLNGTTVDLAWSGQASPGWSLKGYEAQYKAQSAQAWVTLQSKDDTNTGGNFTGMAGHTYQVRVRSWQTMATGYNSDIDIPGVWQEATVTLGDAVLGVVLDNQGQPLSNATVAVSNTMTSTISLADGTFQLTTGSGAFAITATHPSGWYSLDPISVTTSISETASLTLTLAPPDTFIENGGLEGAFDGWTQDLLGTLAQASFETADVRSGVYSLRIFGSGSMSQTGEVSNMYRPTLSFWHKVEAGDGNNNMVVTIRGEALNSRTGPRTLYLPATPPLTISQTTDGWQHVSYPLVLSATEVFSGNLSVEFSVTQVGTPTTFYVDEVSFGRICCGPHKIFLPVVLK